MTHNTLNREIRIILWAIREKGNNPAETFPYKKDDIDWEKLRALSGKHGVLPILYKKLKRLKSDQITSKDLEKFKSLNLNIIHWNLIQANQLITILKLLEEKGINVIPFKGPILSAQAYGDLGYRIFCDIDILINPKDFSRVYNTMINEGFRPNMPLTEKKKKYWSRSRRDFEFYTSNAIIDFHQRLTQAHYSFSLSEKEMREENFIYLMNHKIRILSPENTVLSICIHSTKDQWNSLKMISDLSYFLHANPELDWDKLIKKAKKMGISRMVLTGFLLLKEILNESFPEKVLKMIQKNTVVHQLAKKYKAKIFTRNIDRQTLYRVTSIAKTLDSPWHCLRFLLHFTFSPTPLDFSSISIPEFLYPLYYLVRPLRLIFKLFSKKR